MKNKTLRTNAMKLKKVIAASLAISVLFAFTGCGNSSSTTNTKQESSSTTETGSTDELNKKLDDLYQQENQLFADHKDAWDKVFGLMNKNTDGDAMNENYADFLASTVESNKDSFSEEEYETLSKDIETIRGIEEEIAKLEKESAASESSDNASSKSDESTGVFKGFKGKDLDGNDVDDSLFAKNKVTVVNFWFSGCKPCVGELSKLNELNEKLKEMGGEVVGINSAKLASTEVEGMGYSIAISDVTDILQNLMNETSRDKLDDSEHGVLGIKGSSVSSEAVQMYGIPAGVFVKEVTEGGAADKAGLKANSVITEFNGKAVSSTDQQIEYLSYYEPDEEVELTVQVPHGTSYKEETVKVTLDENTDADDSDDNDKDSKKSKKDSKKSSKDADEDVDEDTDSEDSMDSDDTEESENPFIQYFENQGFFR